MDIRFLIVGAPFIVSFFYTLFWLKRWGAFDSFSNNYSKKITLKEPSRGNYSKKMTLKNEPSRGNLILEKIFLTKN